MIAVAPVLICMETENISFPLRGLGIRKPLLCAIIIRIGFPFPWKSRESVGPVGIHSRLYGLLPRGPVFIMPLWRGAFILSTALTPS